MLIWMIHRPTLGLCWISFSMISWWCCGFKVPKDICSFLKKRLVIQNLRKSYHASVLILKGHEFAIKAFSHDSWMDNHEALWNSAARQKLFNYFSPLALSLKYYNPNLTPRKTLKSTRCRLSYRSILYCIYQPPKSVPFIALTLGSWGGRCFMSGKFFRLFLTFLISLFFLFFSNHPVGIASNHPSKCSGPAVTDASASLERCRK